MQRQRPRNESTGIIYLYYAAYLGVSKSFCIHFIFAQKLLRFPSLCVRKKSPIFFALPKMYDSTISSPMGLWGIRAICLLLFFPAPSFKWHIQYEREKNIRKILKIQLANTLKLRFVFVV